MQQARSDLGAVAANCKIYAIGGKVLDYQNELEIHSKAVATNEEYNSVMDSWSFRAAMPTARYSFATVTYQNKIYCISGSMGNSLKQGDLITAANQVYDPAMDTWQNKTDIPVPKIGATAHAVDGKIYVMGGYPNSTLVQMYDPANDSWSMKSSIPLEPYDDWTVTWGTCEYVAYNDTIYAFGGYYMTRDLDWLDSHVGLIKNQADFQSFSVPATKVYDPNTDKWTSAPSSILLASNYVGTTAGFMAPVKTYAFDSSITQVYDPLTQATASAAPNPNPLGSSTVAVLDDVIYVMGGFTKSYPENRLGGYGGQVKYYATVQAFIPLGYGSVPPEIEVTSPVTGNYTSETFKLNFTTNRAHVWAGYSLDGQDNVTATPNVTLTLPTGIHNLTVYATDEYGNTGKSQLITLNVAEPTQPQLLLGILVVTLTIVLLSTVAAGVVYYRKRRRRSAPAYIS